MRLAPPFLFFFQGEDGIRDDLVTGVQTCALPISDRAAPRSAMPIVEVTDPVQLIYTSGTTGRPKAAICTHRMLHYQMLNSLNPYELTSSSRYLAVLPFFN